MAFVFEDILPGNKRFIFEDEPEGGRFVFEEKPEKRFVFEDRPKLKMEEPPLKAKYPNLYGMWGVAKELVPYIKYVDPDEREKFAKLSTGKQTRELLLQNLETVAIVGAGPILKGMGAVAGATLARLLPKTHKVLTTPIKKLGQKTVAQKIAKYKAKYKEHPSPETIKGWWKQTVSKEIPKTPVEKMYDATDIELEKLDKPSVVAAYHGLKRAMIDVSGNVKKRLVKEGGQTGKEAVIRHDLIRGAGPKAERLINEASDKIYGGLSKADEITLNRIIQSRRTITIEGYKPEVKHPGGLGAKEHQVFLDTLPREVAAGLNKKADLYFAEMRTQLSQLRQRGLLTEESYQGLLKAGDYSPRQFLQHIDPERTYTFGGKKITISDSGIQKLAEGSEQLLQNNSRALLAQVITRTQARVFRNEANQALFRLAMDVPDNTVVSLSKIAKKTKAGKLIYQKAPSGYEKVSVMIEGRPRELLMPTDMAREWIVNDPAINTQMANIIGWMSGAKILKPMATGLNPEFALTNMPRDIVHAWLTTHEYSSSMPKWVAQMGRDFATTAKDAFTRKGAFIDYIDEGGGMSFLTHQGRITSKTKGIAALIQKVLGYLGETSEIWTRLALRQRAIRNGKAGFEATWEARNYLDFSQGGWAIKGADTAIPYLNASIQATRGLARAASEKPIEFMYKSAQLGTLATGLLLANRFTNPECWDSISDRDKVNNFIITTPLTYTDKNGETRHLYFKIAKDQSQRLLATLFENMVGKYLGEDINVDQITQAAQDLIPIIPTQTVPPTMDAMLGYYANKDFWTNKDIWRGPKVEPSEEYTRFTHPVLVKFGKTGLSPERTKYVLENFFTYGNIYTSMVGGGLRQIMDKMPGDVKESTMKEMLAGMPFIRKMMKSTNPYFKHRKELEEIKIAETTERYKKTRELDALSEIYYKDRDKTAKKDILAFIKEQPAEDRSRLHKRFIRYGKVYNIPDRRWWLNIAALSPEARATVYWTRWQQADDEEKKRLETQLPRIPGIISGKFILRLQQLKRK